jgi:hypothetical protein
MNISYRIFHIFKRRYELAPKSIISLKSRLEPTTQRVNTLSKQWLKQKPKRQFQTSGTSLNFGPCIEVNTQKLQSMLYNYCR